MKLGEALIQQGLITQDQLRTALDRQVVLGGRIDTNIVELKYLKDEQLTLFVGKLLRLPAIPQATINSIPDEVISLLDKGTVQKYMVLPFQLERQRLHIAMLNPNMKTIDNLRFVTGYEIIPYVITELRLLYALDKYYGIERDTRYISLDESFTEKTTERSIPIEKRIIPRGGGIFEAKSSAQEKIRGTQEKAAQNDHSSEFIGALLLNAIYTAKLLYQQQGVTPPDSQIEGEVLARWKLLSRKVEGDTKNH